MAGHPTHAHDQQVQEARALDHLAARFADDQPVVWKVRSNQGSLQSQPPHPFSSLGILGSLYFRLSSCPSPLSSMFAPQPSPQL